MARILLGSLLVLTLVLSAAAQSASRTATKRTLTLPVTPYRYANVELPAHFTQPGQNLDNTPLELADLINRVLDKGAVIAGSVTISVGDIDLVQLDLTVVLTAIETVRSAERRRRESRGDVDGDVSVLRS